MHTIIENERHFREVRKFLDFNTRFIINSHRGAINWICDVALSRGSTESTQSHHWTSIKRRISHHMLTSSQQNVYIINAMKMFLKVHRILKQKVHLDLSTDLCHWGLPRSGRGFARLPLLSHWQRMELRQRKWMLALTITVKDDCPG